MQKFGIDISVWQMGINFDKVKAEGVEFAILRGACHRSKDLCFERFYAACKARNIPVGVYLYSKATTAAAAKQEADFLIQKVLLGKQLEYPVYIDVETKKQKKAGKAAMTEAVTAFCEAIKAAGYLPGVYTSLGFFNAYLDDGKLPYEKWVAQWHTQCQYTGDLGIWQFGGETNKLRSNKIAGRVCDQDYCYKDYPAIIKTQGLSGPKKVKAKEPARFFLERNTGTYIVTASALNVRHGAGITKEKMVTIPEGTKVQCYGFYSMTLGAKWLYVSFEYNGITYNGFCHSKYLVKS